MRLRRPWAAVDRGRRAGRHAVGAAPPETERDRRRDGRWPRLCEDIRAIAVPSARGAALPRPDFRRNSWTARPAARRGLTPARRRAGRLTRPVSRWGSARRDATPLSRTLLDDDVDESQPSWRSLPGRDHPSSAATPRAGLERFRQAAAAKVARSHPTDQPATRIRVATPDAVQRPRRESETRQGRQREAQADWCRRRPTSARSGLGLDGRGEVTLSWMTALFLSSFDPAAARRGRSGPRACRGASAPI